MLRSMAKCSRATGRWRRPGGRPERGSSSTFTIASASGSGATGARRPAPVAPKSCLVVPEIGRHDRAARCKVNGDLALHGVILAARQPGMDQNVRAAGERDDLRGRLAG